MTAWIRHPQMRLAQSLQGEPPDPEGRSHNCKRVQATLQAVQATTQATTQQQQQLMAGQAIIEPCLILLAHSLVLSWTH